MYLFSVIFTGFGIGFGPCLLCINSLWIIWTWYPTRKGLATGFLMLGYGAGTSLWGLLVTFLVNPDNQYPTESVSVGNQDEKLFTADVARRLPFALRTMAVVIAVTGAGILLLIRSKTSTTEERKSVINGSVQRKSEVEEQPGCPDMRTAMRTPAFWMLFLYTFCAYSYALFILVQYKNYAMTVMKNDQLVSGFGSIAFVWNTLTRFAISVLMDYVTFKKVAIAVMSTQMVVASTLPLVVEYPYVYLTWICVSFVCYAAAFSPVTMVCGEIFGQK